MGHDGSDMTPRSSKFADRHRKPMPAPSRESTRVAARGRASDLASEMLERMNAQDIGWAELKHDLAELIDELEDA
jgi:hypothetical protein